MIKELHDTLMEDGRGSTQSSGQYRKVQNFIGPTNKIEDAANIPIAANQMNAWMENLEYFINKHPYEERLPIEHLSSDDYIFDEDANPLINTAIIHAQFESIHPFLEGNAPIRPQLKTA